MSTSKGIWTISKGKGDRYYINCNAGDSIIHPDDLCSNNGLGMYGYDKLKDLAVAILKFEKEVNESESIQAMVDKE